MTGPAAAQQPQPAAPADLQALLVVQAATLLTFEAGSAYAATSGLHRALAAFARSANGQWLLAGAHPSSGQQLPAQDRDRVIATLSADLRRIGAEAQAELPTILLQQAEHALALGAQHAGEQVSLNVAIDDLVLDDTARQIIASTPTAAVDRLGRATTMLERAQTGQDLQAAVSEADRSIAMVNTGSTYLTNHVANDAGRQVAVRLGEKLLWIAERDACVVCLALAGHIADPNEGVGFDEFATYGPYEPPSVWPFGMPLMRPPRHPHCRCQVCVWLGTAPGAPSLPERLRHEAARSILKGWSLPSESNRVRLKAAGSLLASGGRGLPKSVQEEAARAVASGSFKSRTIPHYQPKEKTHV